MEKLKKLIPEKIQVLSNKVVVDEKIFSDIVKVLNQQSSTINTIIDHINRNEFDLKTLETVTNNLAGSIQALAHSFEVLTED